MSRRGREKRDSMFRLVCRGVLVRRRGSMTWEGGIGGRSTAIGTLVVPYPNELVEVVLRSGIHGMVVFVHGGDDEVQRRVCLLSSAVTGRSNESTRHSRKRFASKSDAA